MDRFDRRSFLVQGAAVMIFGLQEPAPAPKAAESEWLGKALERMKKTGRWGVVLALPPDSHRLRLGHELWALTASGKEDEAAHQLLCEAVFIVLTPEEIQTRFGMKMPATRVLLSSEGKVLASDVQDLSVLSSHQRFAGSFRPFIHGEGNARLIARARELEAGLTAEVKGALAQLALGTAEDQLSANAILAPQAETLTIPLAHLVETGATELLRWRARTLLAKYYDPLSQAPGSRLPYGTSGPYYVERDPCEACGMALMREPSRAFLRFLAPKKPGVLERDD